MIVANTSTDIGFRCNLCRNAETLEEYRNRVFLMYLTTLLAELRLHTNVFLNDAHPLYPGYEPNPQILVDFKCVVWCSSWGSGFSIYPDPF